MSLVVGRGSGSWVWVNVVGKKKFMKRKSPRILFPFPEVSKANRIL